jgi:outer membrane protein TolC
MDGMRRGCWGVIILYCLTAEPGARGAPSAEATFQEAVQLALDHNNDLKATAAATGKAEAARAVARAAYLPKLLLEAGYQHLSVVPEMELNLPLPGGQAIRRTVAMGADESTKVSLILSQNIYNFGADAAAVRAAAAGVDLSRIMIEKSRSETVMRTGQDYFRIQLLREQHELLQRTLEQKKSHFDEVKANYQAGITSQLETLQTEVALEALLPDISDIENKMQLSELALSETVGRALAPRGPLPYHVLEEQLEQFEKAAVERNPSIQSLQKKQQILVERHDSQKARSYPSFSVGARYDYMNPIGLVKKWDDSYALFAGMSWPLFDGFATEGRSDEIAAEIAENKFLLESARQRVLIAVRSAYYSTKTAEQRIKALDRSILLAEKAYHVARVGYENGTATGSAVREAELGVLRAKINRVQALYDQIVAQLSLYSTAGRADDIVTLLGGSK